MRTFSATNLRNDLFNFLDIVESGEVIVIQRNNQEVARLVPAAGDNWRDNMSVKVKLLIPPNELIQSLDDVWEDVTAQATSRVSAD
ncbi:MAG: type II toxin-antitoxin system Phd/YefM family antitoxin [Caldilineaceae bacterium]|nr:type II toxin-antitoxin system Phd/YefM family antitoxin [Caldilineaceae bacterium]